VPDFQVMIGDGTGQTMNRISNNSKAFFVVNLHNASCFIALELNGVQGVEGSNPFIPTRKKAK
jgi:hypothetical protein